MPQLQVVDLNPLPRTEKTYLEKTLEGFAGRNRENQIDQQETDALRDIYGKYQQDGQNLEEALMAVQTRPGLSPTTRVNTVNQLLQMQKYNDERVTRAQKDFDAAEKKASGRRIVEDLEQRRGLEPGSLAPYEDNPAMAAQITKPEKATQASQPINDDQLRRIQHVESQPEFESASVSKKNRMLRNAGVSKENSDAVIKPYVEESKIETDQDNRDKAEARAYHKETEKFDEEVSKTAASAKHQLAAIEDSKKALASGNIRPSSLSSIFRDMGVAGEKISNALMSADEATIQASIPAFLEGRKELFGVRMSDADLRLLQDKLPDIGKSKEANTAILNLMQKSSQASIFKADIAREIKRTNGGLRPLGFRDMVDEAFNQGMQPVRMISPAGYEISVPAYQVEAAVNAGAKLQNE